MAAVSLYVSSLCANAVRAVVTSLVAVAVLLLVLFDPALLIGREAIWVGLLAVLVAMLVTFAAVNHRAEPPPPARVWGQGIAIAALMGVPAVLLKLTAG